MYFSYGPGWTGGHDVTGYYVPWQSDLVRGVCQILPTRYWRVLPSLPL